MKKKGFTLVESLVAIALLLLTLTIIFSLFTTTKKGLQLSESHVDAAFLGKTLLDDARKAGFGSVLPSTGSMTFSGTNNGAPFTRIINYGVTVQTLDTDKKLVTATMTWKESNAGKKVVLETIMVDPAGTTQSSGGSGSSSGGSDNNNNDNNNNDDNHSDDNHSDDNHSDDGPH
ncbi:MAG: prepilin-type N-terminal cleavage/methylation domain-containing protein [Chloroflexi bacterium]|nr:prepilin-type N-terminal cleavage/methylation domain-containing protein [Chloroflexota bacterium]